MKMNITLNEDQIDHLISILQRDLYQRKADIGMFTDKGQFDTAEYFEELFLEEKRLTQAIIDQFVTLRK